MNFKKQKIKFCLIVVFLSVFCIFPQIVLAAQNEQAAVTITLQDIYQEMKEMRKEIQEMRKEMATKDELAKTEQNLQTQINNLGSEITAIWQSIVGLIVALVVTLLGVKYFVFQADIEKTKNALLKSNEFKLQIKDYIKDIINNTKRIL